MLHESGVLFRHQHLQATQGLNQCLHSHHSVKGPITSQFLNPPSTVCTPILDPETRAPQSETQPATTNPQDLEDSSNCVKKEAKPSPRASIWRKRW
mmetsp:Transcript_44941/g.70448  ORF Transcript_44941/g.70448 Transcript_44941/m.70448 type:complete len:96 (-) Transcript_44941:548-835(-)